jgi:hypothetical protein
MGEWSASRPGRFLPPGKTRYPLYRRLGGPQGRSEHVRIISPPPRFDPQTVHPVAIAILTELPVPLTIIIRTIVYISDHFIVSTASLLRQFSIGVVSTSPSFTESWVSKLGRIKFFPYINHLFWYWLIWNRILGFSVTIFVGLILS